MVICIIATTKKGFGFPKPFYNDVFADIVNVLLFDGADCVRQEQLTEGSPYSNYTENGKIRDQERDIYKYWNNNQIRLAAIGFENETVQEADMPLRVWKKMLDKNRKLPEKTFSEYIKKFYEV